MLIFLAPLCQMVDAATALAIAGIVGSAVSVGVAILPQVREWWLDRACRPLKVEIISLPRRFNRAYGLRILIRVRNRLSVAVPVRVGAHPNCVKEDGEIHGTFFEIPPRILLFPSNEDGKSFLLPGRDQREVQIELSVRPGIFTGSEVLPLEVVAFRFRRQEIPIGPYDYTIDPAVS